MKPGLTVLILARNEERRLPACLDSLHGLDANVFVVDSYSNDRMVDILRERGIRYAQHEFTNYALQRNWAQANNPFGTEWVLHIDADERMTPALLDWLTHAFPTQAAESDGFMFSRRTEFLGRWIRHGGHYPAFHLRLFRSARGRCEAKAYDQHFVVDGKVLRVDGADIVDIVASDIEAFVTAHNRWSSLEAAEIVAGPQPGEVKANLLGNPIERRRWLKRKVFERAPLFVRSTAYFLYRYVLRLGFLDGWEGMIFHFLHAFWFRFVIDAKVYELRHAAKQRDRAGLQDG